MRVISGEVRGRKLASFKGKKIRPASDKVRGAIFNILVSTFEGYKILDLFAGTGALGIEALSRGAKKVVFVENSPFALKILQKNIMLCKYEERSEIIKTSVERALKHLAKRSEQFDYIFLDPPYEKGMVEKILKMLSQLKILKEDGTIILKHSGRELPLEEYGNLTLLKQRKYGSEFVSFFSLRKGVLWKG